jgi:hypothetical protein
MNHLQQINSSLLYAEIRRLSNMTRTKDEAVSELLLQSLTAIHKVIAPFQNEADIFLMDDIAHLAISYNSILDAMKSLHIRSDLTPFQY